MAEYLLNEGTEELFKSWEDLDRELDELKYIIHDLRAIVQNPGYVINTSHIEDWVNMRDKVREKLVLLINLFNERASKTREFIISSRIRE